MQSDGWKTSAAPAQVFDLMNLVTNLLVQQIHLVCSYLWSLFHVKVITTFLTVSPSFSKDQSSVPTKVEKITFIIHFGSSEYVLQMYKSSSPS